MQAVAALLFVLAALASCSDDERLTAEQFVARANAVCAESDEKLQEAFEEEFAGETPPTGRQMQAVLKRVAPIAEGTVRRLKDLEPPENLEGRFDDALEKADDAIAVVRKGASSPAEAEAVFSSDEDPFEQANKGFESVGVTTCSQGDGDGGEAGSGIGAGAGTVIFLAAEYQFSGPPTVKAGTVTIALSNRGKERHELDIARLKDGVTAQQMVDAEAAGRDASELVADDDVGHVGPLDPGAGGQAEVTLVPGTYVYACFVDAPDGQPHVAKGMFGEFEVT